jgi:hypothetical protein
MASENKLKKVAFVDKEKEVYTFEEKNPQNDKKNVDTCDLKKDKKEREKKYMKSFMIYSE